jgi:hypothetical protein
MMYSSESRATVGRILALALLLATLPAKREDRRAEAARRHGAGQVRGRRCRRVPLGRVGIFRNASPEFQHVSGVR